jgi:hypothetical protein
VRAIEAHLLVWIATRLLQIEQALAPQGDDFVF